MVAYRVERALLADGSSRSVITDDAGALHIASEWLAGLSDRGLSDNTVKAYGARVVSYLTWTAGTVDWLAVKVSHLHLWRRALSTTYLDKQGRPANRSPNTVDAWLAPVRLLYDWAESEGILKSNIASLMTESHFFAPGTAAGGEFGRRRQVLARSLRSSKSAWPAGDIEWISDAGARLKLIDLVLPARDRFLVDLLYFTGVRIGEALALFTQDLHFGGAPEGSACREAEAHFHVGEPNAVENGARSKSGPRTLHPNDRVIDSYVDYAIERARILGSADTSPHALVTLYSTHEFNGRSQTYSGARKVIARLGRDIDFPLNGPHMLRHTLATRLVRGLECEPVSLDVVQEILGHADLSTTRVYTHDLEQAKRAALREMPTRPFSLGAR